MNKVSLKSFAKINLGLNVIRKREDDFHEIETVFQGVTLYDEITLSESESEEIVITTNHPSVPTDSRNLMYKAADLFRKTYGIRKGVHLHLHKKIPVGAGLGGGSANAASVLDGVNRFWTVGASKEDVMALSLEIGSDVPFFLFGSPAFGRGRGEQLQKMTVGGDFFVLLVNPGIEISAAWAYSKLDLTKAGDPYRMDNFHLSLKRDEIMPYLKNDLENGVFKKYPVLWDIKKWLLASGASISMMSGSGSTVFGIFHSKESALYALNEGKSLGHDFFLTEPIKNA